MIDFKITFKVDELFILWKMRKDESDFKNHVQKISTAIKIKKRQNLLNKV